MRQRNPRISATEFIPGSDNRPLYRKKRFLLPMAVLLTIVIAAVSFTVWYYRSPDELANDATNAIQVDIPDEATQVSAHDDRIRIQGGCSDLSFLLPTPQWQAYVSRYISEPLELVGYPGSNCDGERLNCDKNTSFSNPTSYAGDYQVHNSNGGGGKNRGLYVAPDCHPGKTLISWSAYDM